MQNSQVAASFSTAEGAGVASATEKTWRKLYTEAASMSGGFK